MQITDTRSLRKFLVDKMNDVADGKVEPTTTTAIANLAQQIYNSLNIELKTAIALKKIEQTTVEPVKFND